MKILVKAGITQVQADTAEDCQIINGCLFLLKDKYDDKTFCGRQDFKYVIATNLLSISKLMFSRCLNLELVYAPNVERIEDG